MPLLDTEQHEQVAGMIREGLQRQHGLQTDHLTQVQTELASAAAQMRSTTEEFVLRQTEHNTNIEGRIAGFATDTENKILGLRQELGDEFAKGDAKIVEIDKKIADFGASFEDKKTAMTIDITSAFAEFAEKCAEMRTLIGESSTVLEESKKVINGAIIAVNARIDTMYTGVQTEFTALHVKHAGYDAIIEARGAGGKGGKGGSGSGPFERTGYADSRGYGLLHEKDIRMPLLPEHFDKVETFRRWWKDVAEFCERRQDYTDCSVCSRPSGATRTHWRPRVRWRRC